MNLLPKLFDDDEDEDDFGYVDDDDEPAAEAVAARGSRVRRNEPCPCGSGKKFKRCCLADAPR